ncbi:MAG: hypothetical protein KTR32_33910 [Granulosicoccus sp.]|nr:hypothetical protein [Granulosicoccus sp.]
MDTSVNAVPAAVTAATDTNSTTIEAGYGPTLSSDVASFTQSLNNAEANAISGTEEMMKAVLKPLDHIDAEANDLIAYANSAIESGAELTPSEIVMLTAKSQEFMFHSQLTANIANRSADGLQQLVRQQS